MYRKSRDDTSSKETFDLRHLLPSFSTIKYNFSALEQHRGEKAQYEKKFQRDVLKIRK